MRLVFGSYLDFDIYIRRISTCRLSNFMIDIEILKSDESIYSYVWNRGVGVPVPQGSVPKERQPISVFQY